MDERPSSNASSRSEFSNGWAEVRLWARIAARDEVMLASRVLAIQPRPVAREKPRVAASRRVAEAVSETLCDSVALVSRKSRV